jgi:hypothetical protein
MNRIPTNKDFIFEEKRILLSEAVEEDQSLDDFTDRIKRKFNKFCGDVKE